jgi:hypothetical protein
VQDLDGQNDDELEEETVLSAVLGDNQGNIYFEHET